MNWRIRFHLSTLLAMSLIAAVLVYFNVMVRCREFTEWNLIGRRLWTRHSDSERFTLSGPKWYEGYIIQTRRPQIGWPLEAKTFLEMRAETVKPEFTNEVAVLLWRLPGDSKSKQMPLEISGELPDREFADRAPSLLNRVEIQPVAEYRISSPGEWQSKAIGLNIAVCFLIITLVGAALEYGFSKMTTREKGELILIALSAGAAYVFHDKLPQQWPLGNLVLTASVILLGQGLLRDLWLKYVARKVPHAPGTRQAIRCMCMESTVGVIGVLAGLLLVVIRSTTQIVLAAWFWPGLIALVCVIGFLIKDLVIDFKAWTIRREADHQNIVFW